MYPKASAAQIVCVLLNIRDVPKITEEELLEIFRNGNIPSIFRPRFEEFFYDLIRWGIEDLRLLMKENNLTVHDVIKTFHSLPDFLRSRKFQEVLDHGGLE